MCSGRALPQNGHGNNPFVALALSSFMRTHWARKSVVVMDFSGLLALRASLHPKRRFPYVAEVPVLRL